MSSLSRMERSAPRLPAERGRGGGSVRVRGGRRVSESEGGEEVECRRGRR